MLLKAMNITAGGIRLLLAAAVMAWPTPGLVRDAARPAVAGPAAPDAPDHPAPSAPSPPSGQPKRADFLGEAASTDARRVADWAVSSGDNGGRPFVVIDKIRAKVFVFDSDGRLRGATLALLGRARGDDTTPGIGSRKLKSIRPEERTTPAGRFVAVMGHDLERDILWIDYGAAISLHRVVTGDPGDHRLGRLATTSTLDKRISYGCVNVPARFFEDVVLKAFAGTTGIVYILPETKKIEDVFPVSDGHAQDQRQAPAARRRKDSRETIDVPRL
jgi:hypothetical protein